MNNIGLLTNNSELLADFKNNYFDTAQSNCQDIPNIEIFNYKSVESIKREECSIIIVDFDIFESLDVVQFFLSKIRKKISEIPVLLIIKTNLLNEIKWDWFFDDFILYPFRKGELASRIKSLLWGKIVDNDENIIIIGHLKINLKEYSVHQNDQKLELTYKEFELLRLLVQNKGIVFTRIDLLNRIWGVEYIGGTRTVDVHIRRLRSKLGDEFNSIIETVRNVGYRCKE